MEKTVGGWRTLHNVELQNLYTSPNKVKERETGGACIMYGRDEKCIQSFGREV